MLRVLCPGPWLWAILVVVGEEAGVVVLIVVVTRRMVARVAWNRVRARILVVGVCSSSWAGWSAILTCWCRFDGLKEIGFGLELFGREGKEHVVIRLGNFVQVEVGNWLGADVVDVGLEVVFGWPICGRLGWVKWERNGEEIECY